MKFEALLKLSDDETHLVCWIFSFLKLYQQFMKFLMFVGAFKKLPCKPFNLPNMALHVCICNLAINNI